MTDLPVLKIFLSSPGDVAEERALAEIVFRRLAEEVADSVKLNLVIWEHEPLFGHTGFQQQIERPSQCDLVVSILWSRLGTRLPSDFAPAVGESTPTGTQFELQDALASYSAVGKPHLLIYKKIPGPQIGLGTADFAERTQQFQALDDFCKRAFFNADGAVIVAHTTFTDSHDFERRLGEHVRRWLDREIQSPHADEFRPLWRGKSPFRGLQPFEAEHQAIFFGRSEALGDLMRRIRDLETAATADAAVRLLVVQGMSGAGKTSLVKAGLLPLLQLRPVEGIAQWITVSLRPSESDPAMRAQGPLGILAARLNDCVPAIARLGSTVPRLAETLYLRPQEAVAKLETWLAADADRANVQPRRVRLLIYIDQLEEVFTLPDSSASAASFLAALAALAQSANVWVVATLRSDFVHRLEAFPDFVQCLSRNAPYTLLPPRSDELAEMIREPARAAGLVWEQRGGLTLDQELLRDAAGSPEALPLLEYTLEDLYERRDGRLLRWSDYGGGLRGALIAAADEVVEGLTGDADAAFRDVMRELVSVGDDGVAARRYASLARFRQGSEAHWLLERLVARRLCVTTDEGRGDGPVACLSHEALIRSWPRVQTWLQRETSLLRIRDDLSRDAAVWEFHQRANDWLGVSPEKLATIRQIEEAGLVPDGIAAEYASASRIQAARNRLVRRTAIAGICLLTILSGVACLVALKQRDIARIEAATADRTTRFMVSLFQLADPSESRGDAVTVKEVLDKGAQEMRNDKSNDSLQRDPRIRAELLTAMGQAYSGLGLYKPADELLRQARIDLSAASLSDESRVRTLVASGSNSYLAGDYDAAEPVLRSAVDLARRRLDPANTLRSQALSTLADVLVQLGKYPEAVQLCREALLADRKRDPQDAAVTAQTLDSLGEAYFFSGDLAQAEAPLREALELRKNTFGLRHPLTAISLDNLGVFLYQFGRYDEALAVFRQALPIYDAVYGPEHREVATLLSNIGRSALMAGHIDEAEPLLRRALAMTEKFEGATHDDLVSPLNSLAMIDAYLGHLDAARDEIQRAESISRLPHQDELLDQVLLTEADLELAMGNRSRTGELLQASKAEIRRLHPQSPSNAWRYAVWDSVNAQYLAQGGNHAEAERTLTAAQDILVKRFGAGGFYNMLAKRRALVIAKAGTG